MAAFPNDERLLTSGEYAQILGISVERLYKMNREGSLPIRPIELGTKLLRWSRVEHNKAVARLSLLQPSGTLSSPTQEDS